MLELQGRKVFLALGVTDMRKAAKGLSILVESQLEMGLFSGDLFCFCNRRRNLIKILVWDHNGFWLFQKRLEKERFCWPRSDQEVAEIAPEKLAWLLQGLDIQQAHQRLEYQVTF